MSGLGDEIFGSGNKRKPIIVQVWLRATPKISFHFAASATKCVEDLVAAIEELTQKTDAILYYLRSSDRCEEEVDCVTQLFNSCEAASRHESRILNIRWVDDVDQLVLQNVKFIPMGWTDSDAELSKELENVTQEYFDVLKELNENAEELDEEDGASDRPCFNVALCDVCECEIRGRRYRCLICQDYDLCTNCEATGVHTFHALIRILEEDQTQIPKFIKGQKPINQIMAKKQVQTKKSKEKKRRHD